MEEKVLVEGIVSSKFLLLGKTRNEINLYEVIGMILFGILASIGIILFLSHFIRPGLELSCIPGMEKKTLQLIAMLTFVVGGLILCYLGYIIQILLILAPITYVFRKLLRYWYEHNILYKNKIIKYQLTINNLVIHTDKIISIDLHNSSEDLCLLVFEINNRTKIKGCVVELKNKEMFKEIIDHLGTSFIFIDKAPNELDTDFTVKSIRDLAINHKYLRNSNETKPKRESILKLILEFIIDPSTWI